MTTVGYQRSPTAPDYSGHSAQSAGWAQVRSTAAPTTRPSRRPPATREHRRRHHTSRRLPTVPTSWRAGASGAHTRPRIEDRRSQLAARTRAEPAIPHRSTRLRTQTDHRRALPIGVPHLNVGYRSRYLGHACRQQPVGVGRPPCSPDASTGKGDPGLRARPARSACRRLPARGHLAIGQNESLRGWGAHRANSTPDLVLQPTRVGDPRCHAADRPHAYAVINRSSGWIPVFGVRALSRFSVLNHEPISSYGLRLAARRCRA